MSVIDMKKVAEKHASLSMKLHADSGYTSEAKGYRVSALQWSALIAICEDGEMGKAMLAIQEAALATKVGGE